MRMRSGECLQCFPRGGRFSGTPLRACGGLGLVHGCRGRTSPRGPLVVACLACHMPGRHASKTRVGSVGVPWMRIAWPEGPSDARGHVKCIHIAWTCLPLRLHLACTASRFLSCP